MTAILLAILGQSLGWGCPFCDPVAGCVDFAGHPRVVCGRIDIGAFEGMGDGDCDGDIDVDDFVKLTTDCWTGPRRPLWQFGYPPGCEAFDDTCDGNVCLKDLVVFLRRLK